MRFSSRAWYLAFLALVVVVAAPTRAEDSLKVSYQGRLTDDAGNPLDTNVIMMFTIYDDVGVPQWSETQAPVSVTAGLFDVILGSESPIPESVFGEPELYLGITVGSDPEIRPQTELTYVPFAAAAKRVEGAVETGDGYMHLKNINGDSIFTFNTDVGGGSLKMITPLFGGKGQIPVMELSSFADSGRIMLFNPEVTQIGAPGVNIRSDASGGSMGLYNEISQYMGIQPSPFGDGGNISLYLTEPLDKKLIDIGVNSDEGGRINMYSTEPLDRKAMVLYSSLGGEDGFDIYGTEPLDRKLLSVSSAPTVGASFVLFQPQPEPPGKVAMEMSISSAKGSGSGFMSLYDKDSARTMLSAGLLQLSHPTNTDLPDARLSTDSIKSEFNMKGVALPEGGDPAVIAMVARNDSAKVGIGTDAPQEALHVIGNIGLTGEVMTISPTKLKKNISTIDGALDKIVELRGVSFDWRTNEYESIKLPESRSVGLLAEEVEQIFPELVHEDGEGTKYVAYSKLTAVLIEAVKELKAENEELQKRIELLELR